VHQVSIFDSWRAPQSTHNGPTARDLVQID
jgi:hypothetical protein